jgi:hypothetical protein
MDLKYLFALALGVAAVGFGTISEARETRFSIFSAEEAISIAKKVCLKYASPIMDEDENETSIKDAMPTLQWGATFTGDYWVVDTMPSVVAGTNDALFLVYIPVEGPAPHQCIQSMYELALLKPEPPKPRGPCVPSDISAPDARELSLEAPAPKGEATMMVLQTLSEADAWVVSVGYSLKPDAVPSYRDVFKAFKRTVGVFRVFKRTADVVNIGTGEKFTSLPSKARFVEHHCLNGA